jgi:hypothetical protein
MERKKELQVKNDFLVFYNGLENRGSGSLKLLAEPDTKNLALLIL